MYRLRLTEPGEITAPTEKLFRRLVFVPNLLWVMANSDAAIEFFSNHISSLEKYTISRKYRELISIAVSQYNRCDYCLALHTSNAVHGKVLTEQECREARRMHSSEEKKNILLKLTKEILEKKGSIDDETIQEVKEAGFNDRDIIEIIAIISSISMANYTANVAEPEIDFPEPPGL